MARPKVRTSNGHLTDSPPEELSCGYIMHQHKKVNSKMRWGQLWTGQGDGGQYYCKISLFKFDIANPKPLELAKRNLKLKANFEFNEDDFCGLEKGEHLSRHGKKRFICVILKDKHIILQDAIIAMTDTDHDVIGTWYRKITDAMKYMYRWRILGLSDAKYLHISRVNTCECFSVHNSNAGQRGKLLLDQLYKTQSIVKVDEYQEIWEGALCTRVEFCEVNHGMDNKISLLLESGKKLYEVLLSSGHSHRPTLAGRFDILFDGHPNLVKIPPTPKSDPPTSLKELSVVRLPPETNNYIDTVHPNPNSVHSKQNGCAQPYSPSDMHPTQNLVTGGMRSMSIEPRRGSPHGNGPSVDPGNLSRIDKRAPRPHDDTRPRGGPMDDPKNATQTSLVDSDYHTQTSATNVTSIDHSAGLSSQDFSRNYENFEGPYINIPNEREAMSSSNSSRNTEPTDTESAACEPPAIPPREPTTSQQISGNPRNDLVEVAIQDQLFPPIDRSLHHQAYENNEGIAVTISTLLERNDTEPVDTSFGLPYSIFRELLLGLEAQSITGSDWRGLAIELGMTFHEVEQIDSAVHNHPQLFAPQIVLLQWQRAQAPFPCTLSNLKRILSEKLGRLDLANLIFLKKND